MVLAAPFRKSRCSTTISTPSLHSVSGFQYCNRLVLQVEKNKIAPHISGEVLPGCNTVTLHIEKEILLLKQPTGFVKRQFQLI